MENEFLMQFFLRLTIDKAKMEDKHPLEILEEVKRLLEWGKMEHQIIIQIESNAISAN